MSRSVSSPFAPGPESQALPARVIEPPTSSVGVECSQEIWWVVPLPAPLGELSQREQHWFAPSGKKREYCVPGCLEEQSHRTGLRTKVLENDISCQPLFQNSSGPLQNRQFMTLHINFDQTDFSGLFHVLRDESV
jgi:hypothetical protein